MKKKILLAVGLVAVIALVLLFVPGAKDEKTAELTAAPAAVATEVPTEAPTEAPTAEPTEEPTAEPTEAPTAEPTEEPTAEPTAEPAVEAAADVVTEEVVIEEVVIEETVEATAGEAEADPVLASAYSGEITVRASEVRDDFEALVESYIQYFTQYGYAVDAYDEEVQTYAASDAVQNLLSIKILERYTAEQGYELTEERLAELKAEVQVTLDSVREYYESQLSYYGLAGEELTSAVEQELAATGYTEDNMLKSMLVNEQLAYLNGLATADVTVTEEDAIAHFEAKVETAKANYANVDTFINDYLAEADILYTPENVRLMYTLFVALDDADMATPGEAAMATPAEAAMATPAEAATPGEATDIASLTGAAKAQAIVDAVNGGMDFVEAMIAYNEDSSTEEQLLYGYPTAEGSILYGEEWQTAAMSLENIGDVTGVVTTEYGHFILMYAKDLESGAVEFAPRAEQETAEALAAKQQEAYNAYVEEMLLQAGVELGDMTPLFHVYGEAAEAVIAYGAVTGEAQLLDMPGGDAVATLAQGASLDVLAKIGVDGEEYAFVSVPNTAFKGYVNVTAMANMEEAEALAMDNTALVTPAEALDKLPTFTVVMNDGSLIYGELYPDVAPESVGNFVSLANAGFYDGLIFHRVIPGFMIQGGDPNGNGTGGPGYAIRGEFTANGVENALSHTRGVLSMARSQAMDSAGSQFFIMHADSDFLDGQYAAFGMVLGGIETVDLIASVPTDANDKPQTEQAMRTVYVETYGKTYEFTKLED
ncbi:MAG: peptidylprolyl isomerase [Clostridia bacterium]|nr:peptidylprolyl isomerase [Clostridia bacterium]